MYSSSLLRRQPLNEGAFDKTGKFPVEDKILRNAKASLLEGGVAGGDGRSVRMLAHLVYFIPQGHKVAESLRLFWG